MRENIHIIIIQIITLLVVALGYWSLQMFGVFDRLTSNGWSFYFYVIFIFVGIVLW